jgi:hypothetical protein
MRPCLYPGVTETEVRDVLDDTLRAADFELFFDIVEFGKSALCIMVDMMGRESLKPEC